MTKDSVCVDSYCVVLHRHGVMICINNITIMLIVLVFRSTSGISTATTIDGRDQPSLTIIMFHHSSIMNHQSILTNHDQHSTSSHHSVICQPLTHHWPPIHQSTYHSSTMHRQWTTNPSNIQGAFPMVFLRFPSVSTRKTVVFLWFSSGFPGFPLGKNAGFPMVFWPGSP